MLIKFAYQFSASQHLNYLQQNNNNNNNVGLLLPFNCGEAGGDQLICAIAVRGGAWLNGRNSAPCPTTMATSVRVTLTRPCHRVNAIPINQPLINTNRRPFNQVTLNWIELKVVDGEIGRNWTHRNVHFVACHFRVYERDVINCGKLLIRGKCGKAGNKRETFVPLISTFLHIPFVFFVLAW